MPTPSDPRRADGLADPGLADPGPVEPRLADARATEPRGDGAGMAPADPVPSVAPAAAPRPIGAAEPSIGDLVSDLFSEATTLVQQEVALAKTEARQEIAQAGAAVGRVVAGGAVAYAGLIALVVGLGWALGLLVDDDAAWLGIALAGAAVVAVGAFLLKRGLDALGRLTPPLDTTVQSLREDARWIADPSS